MISSTLGAPFGGTICGGHQVLDPAGVSLITPPNLGDGGGSCLPSIVVVAPGDPNTPVTCCASAGTTVSVAKSRNAAALATPLFSVVTRCMLCAPPAETRQAISPPACGVDLPYIAR